MFKQTVTKRQKSTSQNSTKRNAIYGEEHHAYQYGQSHTETKSAQWSQATAIVGMTGLNMKVEPGGNRSEIIAGYQHGD